MAGNYQGAESDYSVFPPEIIAEFYCWNLLVFFSPHYFQRLLASWALSLPYAIDKGTDKDN